MYAAQQVIPTRPVHITERQIEAAHHVCVEAFTVQNLRDVVNARGVNGGHHRFGVHVTHHRDFPLDTRGNRTIRPQDNRIGLDADISQRGDRMLRRLRLQLSRRTDVWQQGHVQEEDIVTTHLVADLPNCLEERQRLDISDGAPNLSDDDVHVRSGHPANPCLDLVRDVRNHLHGVAEILAAAFLRDDGGVHLTRGDVRRSEQVGIQEAFVVPDI